MAGFGRRSKPLKAGAALVEIDGVALDALTQGDLLVYDAVSEAFLNSRTLDSSYVITGGLTAATLTTSGNATLGGALTLAGNAALAGTLAVAGSTTLQALSATTLALSGDATVGGTLLLSGAFTGTSGDFSSTLEVEGIFTAHNDAVMEAIDATSLELLTTLTVGGAGVFSADVSIAGALSVGGVISTASAFSAPGIGSSGTLTASGATALNSTLSVSGAATLASTLAVTGATTLGSTLAVTGAATLSSTLAVTGTTALSAALTGTTAVFTGTVRSEGTLTHGTTAGVHMDLDTDETIWFNGATRLGEVGMTTTSVWYVHLGSPAENAIVANKDGSVDLYYNNVLALQTASGGAKTTGAHQITGALDHDGTTAGFYNTTPTTKQTVTGSRGGNAALASLLTALATIGLITDSSSA